MNLPFDHQQFVGIFAQYNQDFFWLIALIWLATAGSLATLIKAPGLGSRLLCAVLVVHWLWSGLVYHTLYFSKINTPAYAFGMLFGLQATIIAWRGLLNWEIKFTVVPTFWPVLGLMVVFYGMLYPFIGLAVGAPYPQLPLFAVPCPTTIITLGGLLLLPWREAILLGIIPMLWAVVGGSAAFLLNVPQDLGLIVAGFVTLGYWLLGKSRR